MKPQIILFELVNSLSKAEAKKLVKRLTDAGTEHAILQLELFKVIRSARTIDSDVILSRLNSAELKKYFSFHKGGLLDQLLGMLSEQVKDEVIVERRLVLSELEKVQVLHQRGFEAEALKRIAVLTENLDSEMSPVMKLVALNDQYRMLRTIPSADRNSKLRQLDGARRALLNVIQNESDLNLLKDKVYAIYSTFRQSKHSQIDEQLQIIFSDKLLQSEDYALTFQARVSYNQAHVFRHSLIGNPNEQIKYQKRVVELWGQNANQRKRRPFVYQYALINLLSLLCENEEFTEVEELYRKAMKVDIRDNKERAAGMIALIDIRLQHLINTQGIEDVLKYEKSVRGDVEDNARYAVSGAYLNLQYNLSSVLFLAGKFKLASKGFLEIIETKGDVRTDLKGVARMLMTLSEFDRRDPEYLLSLNAKSRRFFRKHDELDKLHGVVFRLVDQLCNCLPNEKQETLRMALTQIEQMEKDQPTLIGLEAVSTWIRSKMENKPIVEIWNENRIRARLNKMKSC